MKGESFLALLAGAAAGLTLGVLFAPDSGEKTRAKIKKAASEGYEDLKDITSEAAHDLQVKSRYARKEINSLKNTLAEHGAELKEEAREKILEQLAKLEKALAKEESDVKEKEA